jgi:hypothetical protein
MIHSNNFHEKMIYSNYNKRVVLRPPLWWTQMNMSIYLYLTLYFKHLSIIMYYFNVLNIMSHGCNFIRSIKSKFLHLEQPLTEGGTLLQKRFIVSVVKSFFISVSPTDTIFRIQKIDHFSYRLFPHLKSFFKNKKKIGA